jgi:hypothetical protein
MKFELEHNTREMSDDDILEDMRRCAKTIGRNTITSREYDEIGKVHPSTMQRRFGSWPNALKQAGLQPSRSKIGITNDELFENIKTLWISLGRQPRYNEVKAPTSLYSTGTYENRFGSWSDALKRFVEWVNSDSQGETELKTQATTGSIKPTSKVEPFKRRTRREITERQRFRVLVRDGFKCMSCGASPLVERGIELHVDHILPWSKGGETIDKNLETKCKKCNLGKGNAFEV